MFGPWEEIMTFSKETSFLGFIRHAFEDERYFVFNLIVVTKSTKSVFIWNDWSVAPAFFNL